jgi:DNA-binding winged helix-turn-helix (wHTH) protein
MDARERLTGRGLEVVAATRAAELAAPQTAVGLARRPGEASEALHLRSFVMLPAARLLLQHGRPVDIGSRAFDLLHVLLRSRGSIVERADILRHVWPTTVVEDSNLRFQVSRLRKALGKDRDLLKTVPGRGYLLAAEVATAPSAWPTSGHAAGPVPTGGDLQILLQLLLAELQAATNGAPRVEISGPEPGHDPRPGVLDDWAR